jgi:DNA-3-methyladenine glycosylase II
MIDSEEALAQAVEALVGIDPRMAGLLSVSGPPPLRKSTPGFGGLVDIVVGQQVSQASARAIRARIAARYGVPAPADLAAATDEDLRLCGLSRPKMAAVRAIAEAILGGVLPLDDLHGWTADEAHARLVSVRGIGPWTADVYLLFCLGHPDAFPAGDLALQEAARRAFGLPERPGAKALAAMAEAWRPWRGAAAGVLWAYYAATRGGRDGAPVERP